MNLDINAICEFENLTGKTFGSMTKQDDIGLTDIRALVQAGLGLTDPKEAGKIIQEYMASEEEIPLLEIIQEKISATMPTKAKKK